jgi:hypothetical protein
VLVVKEEHLEVCSPSADWAFVRMRRCQRVDSNKCATLRVGRLDGFFRGHDRKVRDVVSLMVRPWRALAPFGDGEDLLQVAWQQALEIVDGTFPLTEDGAADAWVQSQPCFCSEPQWVAITAYPYDFDSLLLKRLRARVRATLDFHRRRLLDGAHSDIEVIPDERSKFWIRLEADDERRRILQELILTDGEQRVLIPYLLGFSATEAWHGYGIPPDSYLTLVGRIRQKARAWRSKQEKRS